MARKFIAKANRSSLNMLGSVGRPVAVGVGAALVAGPGLTQASILAGNPIVLPTWAVVGSAVAAVVVVEGALRVLGSNNAEVDTAEAEKAIRRMAKNLKKDGYSKDLKKALKEAGLSKAEVAMVMEYIKDAAKALDEEKNDKTAKDIEDEANEADEDEDKAAA